MERGGVMKEGKGALERDLYARKDNKMMAFCSRASEACTRLSRGPFYFFLKPFFILTPHTKSIL